MKKLLLLLLIAPVLGFGQVLTDVFYKWQEWNTNKVFDAPVKVSTYQENEEYFLEVPANKFWIIKDVWEYQEDVNAGNFYLRDKPSYVNIYGYFDPTGLYFVNQFRYDNIGNYNYEVGGSFIPSGTKFFVEANGNRFYLLIYEYSLDGNSLSYNEPEAIKNNSNTPVLFPNPTSSLLALNSEKEYDIEVYDMAGNKVMALTGNTIDMSHLSSATYIVKALDKVENEEVSYKVVKN
jgi:hypothetical protein